MKKYLIGSLLAFGCYVPLVAQLQVESGLTLEQYVNDVLLGPGVQATNISYVGGEEQLGYLTGGEGLFPIASGLIMSTDNTANFACQPNTGCDNCLGFGLDLDLLGISNSVSALIDEPFFVSGVADLCVLEFDFVAASDTVRFDYSFGSDEYPFSINMQFNDIFALFLSGPGIEGQYASPSGFPNGAVNIATVPGTDPELPITVSSLNASLNSEFYVDNQGSTDVCINAYTTPLTASHAVQCGESYHIKLAIADASDIGVESVVVLEEGSFLSYASVQMDLGIDLGEAATTIYEDCGLASLTLARPINSDPAFDEVIYLHFDESQATNGVDFGQFQFDGSLLPLPDSVIFEPFVDAVVFELIAAIDGELEGPEAVEIQIETVGVCGETGLFTFVNFLIDESPPPLEVDGLSAELTLGQALELAPTVSGGVGSYTYDWLCNGNTLDTYSFEPDEAGLWLCEVMVGDTCGVASESAFIEVEVIEILPPDNAFCGYEFLEGGAYIPDFAGECFTREVEVAIGDPNAVISDVSDMSFFVNMEHSYMGDLTITFTCPNGQSLEVQTQGGGNTSIGIPDQLDGTGPGTGLDYYWSPLASSGTWTDNQGGELPTGIYESAAPFEVLLGCPQDGIWEISICDLWGADDGWVFEWGVAFGDCALDSGCTEPEACNYLPGTILDDGSCTFPGCIDNSACNYDPLAGCDDGSCLLSGPGFGCVDPNACNFDPNASCADDSCIYPLVGDDCMTGAVACSGSTQWDVANQVCVCDCVSLPNDCPTDLNGNGFVEITDLLLVLGDFGSECPPE